MEVSPALVVAIGGSAGSLEALSSLVGRLPPGLDAALFVVVHVPPTMDSRLPEILARRGPLPVRHARAGDLISGGRILVAPPDHHLLLVGDHVELSRGPRENSTRPAIDPLFRSAAEAFGPAACGVVVSGNLDDGSEGLRRIVVAGGVGIVQDPDEAAHPEMPRNALARCGSCCILPARRIGEALADLARGSRLDPRAVPGGGSDVGLEPVGAADSPGVPTGFSCPECHGVLWTSSDGDDQTLHCRIGHTFTDTAISHACVLENLLSESGPPASRAHPEDPAQDDSDASGPRRHVS